MKNFILVLIFSIGFMVCGAAPPTTDKEKAPVETIQQDGTQCEAAATVYNLVTYGEAQAIAGNSVSVSVDQLMEENRLFASLSPFPQADIEDPPQLEEGDTVLDYIKKNWLWLLGVFIPVLEVIVRLTPTEKDNTILSRLLSLLGRFIPNLRKGGGTHATPS